MTHYEAGCCTGSVDTETLAALLSWESWLDGQGWDRPAELRWLARDLGGQVIAARCQAPRGLYDDAAPYLVAPRIASAITLGGHLPPDLPERVVGVAFTAEAWVVEHPPPGTPEEKYTQALREERALWTHRDKREARWVEAVDLVGHEYSIARVRDRPPEYHTWAAADAWPYRGEVNEALRELAHAIRRQQGRDAPPPAARVAFGLN